MLVYDITDRTSFEQTRNWMRNIRSVSFHAQSVAATLSRGAPQASLHAPPGETTTPRLVPHRVPAVQLGPSGVPLLARAWLEPALLDCHPPPNGSCRRSPMA